MRVGPNEAVPLPATEPAALPPPAAPPRAEGPSAFARLVHGLGRQIDRGESLTARALGADGAGMTPAALLALQAGIYRYGEAVDLAAKLVDRASSAVKTTLQSQ